MMIMESTTRRPPLEPVLPLINVVFLLLIFFMLAGQLAKRPAVEVDTPVSETAQGEEAREKLLLVLQADGQWFANDQDTPLSAEALKALLAAQPEKAPVRLQADAGIHITDLREHLEALRDLGVEQVRLVTRNEAGS